MQVLRVGGSAADAVVAMIAVDCVVCPGSSTLAGSFVAVVDADDSTTVVDGGMATVRADTSPYEHARDRHTGRAVLVPGTVEGLWLLWERAGRLAWDDLWRAAIDVAQDGFVVYPWFAANLAYRRDLLLSSPTARAIFAPGGEVVGQREVLRQVELAHTLRGIARDGVAYTRSGAWAANLVEAVRAAGGYLDSDDLSAHRGRIVPGVSGTYQGHEITACPPNKLGGPGVLLALAMTELLEVDRREHRSRSASTIVAELAIDDAVRAQLAAFAADLATAAPDQVASIFESFSRERAAELAASLTAAGPSVFRPRGSHSVAAADADGMMVAANHTIYSDLWGDTGIFVGGVALNSSALQRMAADPPPGSRIHDFQATLAVRRTGRTICVADATGSGLAGCQTQVLSDLLGRNTPADALLALPRWGSPTGDIATGTTSHVRKIDRFDPNVLADLATLGAQVDHNTTTTKGDVGYWNAIVREGNDYRPITEPRRTGLAIAE